MENRDCINQDLGFFSFAYLRGCYAYDQAEVWDSLEDWTEKGVYIHTLKMLVFRGTYAAA